MPLKLADAVVEIYADRTSFDASVAGVSHTAAGIKDIKVGISADTSEFDKITADMAKDWQQRRFDFIAAAERSSVNSRHDIGGDDYEATSDRLAGSISELRQSLDSAAGSSQLVESFSQADAMMTSLIGEAGALGDVILAAVSTPMGAAATAAAALALNFMNAKQHAEELAEAIEKGAKATDTSIQNFDNEQAAQYRREHGPKGDALDANNDAKVIAKIMGEQAQRFDDARKTIDKYTFGTDAFDVNAASDLFAHDRIGVSNATGRAASAEYHAARRVVEESPRQEEELQKRLDDAKARQAEEEKKQSSASSRKTLESLFGQLPGEGREQVQYHVNRRRHEADKLREQERYERELERERKRAETEHERERRNAESEKPPAIRDFKGGSGQDDVGEDAGVKQLREMFGYEKPDRNHTEQSASPTGVLGEIAGVRDSIQNAISGGEDRRQREAEAKRAEEQRERLIASIGETKGVMVDVGNKMLDMSARYS